MDLWRLKKWKNILPADCRSGIRLHFSKSVVPEVRMEICAYTKWMREQFCFPMRVNVYILPARRIRARDGDMVCGTFFRPYAISDEPYIRVSTGDYYELIEELGKEDAINPILCTFTHELTHYFQHINGLEQTLRGEEWQACYYAKRIVYQYRMQGEAGA